MMKFIRELHPYFFVAVNVTVDVQMGGWKPIFSSSAQSGFICSRSS